MVESTIYDRYVVHLEPLLAFLFFSDFVRLFLSIVPYFGLTGAVIALFGVQVPANDYQLFWSHDLRQCRLALRQQLP